MAHVQYQDVHVLVQRLGPGQIERTYGCRAYEAALLVPDGLLVGALQGYVLHRDEALDPVVVVHYGQLLDPVLVQYLHGLLQAGALAARDHLLGHHVLDLQAGLGEPYVTPRDDAYQLVLCLNDGESLDVVVLHELQQLLYRDVRRYINNVPDDHGLGAFHAPCHVHLFLGAAVPV